MNVVASFEADSVLNAMTETLLNALGAVSDVPSEEDWFKQESKLSAVSFSEVVSVLNAMIEFLSNAVASRIDGCVR